MQEISGVDSPANQLPGWVVVKSALAGEGRSVGPDGEWNVAAAEARIREATKATDGPNPAYASCFLWTDETVAKTASGVPASFGDYKFLVCDAIDGEVQIMPAAVRAAASRAANTSLSTADKSALTDTIVTLTKAMAGSTAPANEEATSVATRLRKLLFPAGKDEVEMTSDELKTELDARDERLVESIKGLLAPATDASSDATAAGESTAKNEDGTPVVAPAADAAADAAVEPAADATPEVTASELTAEDVTKAVGEALAPYNVILEKVLERVEGLEGRFAVSSRKSMDGQESAADETVEKATPKLGDAIRAAFSPQG